MTEINVLCKVQALYPFRSNDPSSLCFEQDDCIDVLTKLPSGWWDGLCNGVRGWFPSNYVKIIQEDEPILEPEVRTRNAEYRLSLLSNHTPNWTIQKTEDGMDTYYYNTTTGEMRIDPPNEEPQVEESIYTRENNENRWSDQSTLISSNIEKEIQQLSNSLTRSSQPNVYEFSHEIPSLTSSSYISQYMLTSPSPVISEPLDWAKLFGHVALTIQQLNTAVKTEQRYTYRANAVHIANAIRYMLVASNTVDKDFNSNQIHTSLHTYNRAMMTSMSKLVLSAQSVYDDPRILSECNELLGNVKQFVTICQELKIPLVPVEPQFMQTKTDESVAINHRYSLQLNLAESLETMGASIQDSAETIMTYVSSWSGDDKNPLIVLLFTHFRNLSNQTGLFLAYLDETDFSSVLEHSEMNDLNQGKKALADSLGYLFVKLQFMTNENIQNFDMCLNETKEATAALFGPIELICTSVLHLATKNKSRINSSVSIPSLNKKKFTRANNIRNSSIEEEEEIEILEDVEDIAKKTSLEKYQNMKNPEILMERHQSEITQFANQRPSIIQRAQTTPSTDKLKKFFGDDAPLETTTTKPVVNERPDFLQYDYGPNDIVFNMDNQVKGGTLPALVERLTMHDYFDMNFINNFLLTYRSFCSSVELLDLLEARYNLKCPGGLTEEEATIWEEKKLKLVRLRVFNVLKNWLELYYNEDDSVLLDRLMTFIETHIRTTLKFSNGQLELLIEKRKQGVAVENVGLKKMVLTLPDPPEPILPKNRRRVKLLDIDTLEIARQLTIMDFKLYSSIRPIECLDKSWSREDDNVASNIRASIEYCNQITSWVSDVILSQQDIKKRSVMIKYWVQVAEKCRMLNNFNTCMAILSAFDNSSVGRLKRTWEAVGARTNQVLQQIRKLMGANRNFVEYRALIHSINPPCIPFLGIYLQDLTFIEDGNANELKKNKDLINFAKRAKTAEVIREIQQYQSSLYQLKTVDEIQEFIKSNLLSTRDEEQLYNESLKIEPREREDEKITRLLQESGFL